MKVRRAGLIAGLLSGLFYALAIPPIGLYGFVFAAPIPLIWACWSGRHKPLTTGFRVGLGMFPWWALAHIWVASVSALGFIPLAGVMSAYTMLAVWAGASVLRRSLRFLFTIPILFVGVEFLRGDLLFHGYPWYLLAHPLADAPVFSWPAAFVGTYGVSLLAAIPAAGLCAWIFGKRVQATGLLIIAALWPALGLVVHPWPESSSTLRVGIVQTNIPQSNKIDWSAEDRFNDWKRMRQLIIQVSKQDPDLIALPEAVAPGMTLDPESLRREFEADLYWQHTAPDGVVENVPATMLTEELLILQRAIDRPILIGGQAFDNLRIEEQPTGGFRFESDARYNSVFVIEQGLPPSERYDKVLLTPFGEVMPYISASKWLEKKLLAFGARGMMFDLAPGIQLDPVQVHLRDGRTVSIATPVCFEATIPWVCRKLVGDTPDVALMVNLTNDGWFGNWDPGRQHHLLCARWRSIETGVSMVRAANTGISCVIGPTGRVLSMGVDDPDTDQPILSRRDGFRVVTVPVSDGRTFYTKTGDSAGWGAFGMSIVLILFSFTRSSDKCRFSSEKSEPGAPPDRCQDQPMETD